jgi:malonate transporter
VASVLAEVYSAVPEEAALTAVLSNAASMVSLMLFIFLLQGAGCL